MNRISEKLALEALVQRHTAFRSWAEFRRAMEAGYVPTMNRHQWELANFLEAAGYKVWRAK